MSLNLSLTATEKLSLTYDGHIPDQLWQAARRIEQTHGHKQRVASQPRVQVGRIRMNPDIAIALMADTIVRSAVARGCVDQLDLRQVGFSQAQVDEYRDRAFALASTNEPRIISMLAPDV